VLELKGEHPLRARALRDAVGLGIARKGWLEPKDVLNTRDAAGFLAFAGRCRSRAA
jgi:hypothetical protein